MHSVEDARAAVLASARVVNDETVGLDEAHGRILREEVRATRDAPLAPTSAMDGFAVTASEALRHRIGTESAAGAPRLIALPPGEAAPISTGAILPPGADAVVPIEDCTLDDGHVTFARPALAGQFVRERGSELLAGEALLRPGDEIGVAAIALLASQGKAHVRVARKPRVAIVSMGRELRPHGEPLGNGDLYDANGPALAALCLEAGASPTVVPVVADDERALADALSSLDADVVVTSGGASVGGHDHLRPAILRAGGEILLWRVAMKPGKPLVLARLRDRPLLGLPGNPVSAIVSFSLFGRPLLRRMMGAEPAFDTTQVCVTLQRPLSARGDRRTFMRARVFPLGAELRAEMSTRQGSAALVSLRGANALVEVPPGDHDYAAGASLSAWMLGPLVGP